MVKIINQINSFNSPCLHNLWIGMMACELRHPSNRILEENMQMTSHFSFIVVCQVKKLNRATKEIHATWHYLSTSLVHHQNTVGKKCQLKRSSEAENLQPKWRVDWHRQQISLSYTAEKYQNSSMKAKKPIKEVLNISWR